MDTTAEGITFDNDGNCNFCTKLLERFENDRVNPVANLEEFVQRVKRDGRGKKYDCIVGLSGGADSSYSIYLAKKSGLRVLAVHMDNGWNSELATNNIQTLISNMEVDLYTHVIDWQEYKQLMQSFFDADVIDIELLYDNAMLAVNYQLASKYGIKYILSGSNSSTEGMRMPKNWNWFKYDKKNIRSIAKKDSIKIKTFTIKEGLLNFNSCFYLIRQSEIYVYRFLLLFYYLF
jgi:7-cyano-7-deazaguanine synthase in queuosine biosynthesis